MRYNQPPYYSVDGHLNWSFSQEPRGRGAPCVRPLPGNVVHWHAGARKVTLLPILNQDQRSITSPNVAQPYEPAHPNTLSSHHQGERE